jgi:putative ABC transport system permease protein
MLLKNKVVTGVAILSLALGIGLNTAIFTVVNAVLFRSLPVTEPERLVAVYGTDAKNAGNAASYTPISYLDYVDYREQAEVFSGLVAFGEATLHMSAANEPEQLKGFIVTGNYFDVLGVKPVAGRTFLPEEDGSPGAHPVVVISYNLWQRRFARDPSLIGKPLSLNTQAFTVIGVAPPNFRGTLSVDNPDFWVPMAMREQVLSEVSRRFFKERQTLILNVAGRLKPGVSLEQAQAAMRIIGERLEREYPFENEDRNVILIPLTQSGVNPNQRGLFLRAGVLILVVVGLILFIACANVANLLLARAMARRKEMALRMALGAGRLRLTRQLLTEGILLALLGGVFGLLLGYWGRDFLWSLRPRFLNQNALDLSLDARVLVYTTVACLLTGLIFGLAPAFQSTRADLSVELRERGGQITRVRGRSRLHDLLVVAQVALSMVSLIGAGLFLRSLRNVQAIRPGFDAEKLLVMSFDLSKNRYAEERGREFQRRVQESAEAVPGVRSAALALNRPLTAGFPRSITVEGQESQSGSGTETLTDIVAVKYFETVGIPLVRGRTFSETDRENTPKVVVINEAAARRFWPSEEALGKRFRFFGGNSPLEVVGVVKNSYSLGLGEEPRPLVYLPLLQNYTPLATLHVRTEGDPQALLEKVRREVQGLDPTLPLFSVSTLGGLMSGAMWAPRMGATLLGFFSLLALILTAIGVYGVFTYWVGGRTNEIGIRMALGAQRRDIIWLVLKRVLMLAAIGSAIGLAIGFAAARLVENLLFEVFAGDPAVFALTAFVLIGVALLAGYLPARRATRIDPLIALRQE